MNGDMDKLRIGIIGAGPGGYIAALSAARRGAHVTLIERDSVGGTCLQKGCIPTKVLYRSCQMVDWAQSALSYGIHIDKVSYDISDILRRKELLVHILTDGIGYLLKVGNVELVRGDATFLSPQHIRVSSSAGSKVLQADRFIIATGSRSKDAPFPIEGMPVVLPAEDILTMEQPPKRIIIAGGGAIGVEIAAIYNTLGVHITLIEKEDSLLSGADIEISNYLKWELEKRGIDIHLNAQIERVWGSSEHCHSSIQYQDGTHEKISAGMVCLAVGRQGNMEGLNLRQIGVRSRNGFLLVNDTLETTVKGIYGIGDVTGKHMLAHAASRQGELLAQQLIKGTANKLTLNKFDIPHCIFSLPEAAMIGYTEREATEAGYPVAVGRFPFSANGKAFVDGSSGFVKVVVNRDTQEILGIHMVGQDASALIGEASLIVTHHIHVNEVADVICPHPTLSEVLREACLSATGKAFHIANPHSTNY